MMRKLLSLILCSVLAIVSYSQQYHNEWIDYNKTYYKFKVAGFGSDVVGAPITKGIVRIPFSALAGAGLGATSAEYFQLWRDGEEVAIYVSKSTGVLGASDYIEFWGEINNAKLDKELYRDHEFQLNTRWSLQTDTAAYFLTVNSAGTNRRMLNATNNVAGTTLVPTPYFMHTVGRYFRNEILNGFSAVAGQNLYSSSYDRGEGYTSRRVRPNNNSCGGSAALPQLFNSLYAYTAAEAPNMRININSVGNAANSRSVRVTLNNDSITTYQMDYFYDAKVEEYVPVSKIVGDAANFVLTNQSSVNCDEFRVAQIELTYPRTFNMAGASNFEINLPSSSTGRYIEFTNFATGGVAPVIYDVNNGKRYEGDISTAGVVKLVLLPSTVAYKLVLTTQAGSYYKSVAGFETRNFIDYSNQANQGNYLIISNPLIYGAGSTNYVEQYRQYRSSTKGGSYISQVVDVNELVDQFAWGVKKHPLSIKNFLRFARNNFVTTPKFAFIIGKGVSYNEYRPNENNALIEKLNLVPTFGYPASDNLLSSNDENAIPATPIGRLSAVTPQEVGDYLQKVKQYDSAQQNTSQTIADKGWMKNVLQIAGANDVSLGAELDGYLQNYKAIIQDTAFGASVTNYSKTGDPSGYTNAVISFKNTFEQGSSLITYFGHSSATSLDFNLDNPAAYENREKYPVFIVNGCTAGNHFTFETNRFNNKSTISEKFVLAPERGAIGYLASSHFGVVNYLDHFTKQLYTAFGKTKYNQAIGIAIQEGISKSLEEKGVDDYYARIHAEQYAYHGDPAIKLNSTSLPDYVIEEPQIQPSPSFISVADTSFTVKVRIHNIGKASLDSVLFKLERRLPDGKTLPVLLKKLGNINLVDSVAVNVPIIGNRDKGDNTLTASIDYDGKINEVTDDNNTASKTVDISEDEIRPIFPYNNSIVNVADFKFHASTVNPLSPGRSYLIEVDTTDFFNSPLKASQVVTSPGGTIQFSPTISLQNNTVYYWRVAPVLPDTNWRSASFKYNTNGETGFERSHFYQHTKAGFQNIYLDSTSKQFSYNKRTNNLFVVNSIYPHSGVEDGHFSVSVNGNQMMASACVGSSVIFQVLDSLTFQPWKNTTQPFGAAATCQPNRQYNFEYPYTSAASRKNAMDFLDAVPKGFYVVARLVLDGPYNTFAAHWAADTAIYGKNNSLYHRLKDQGFKQLDSFYYPRTWAFVFRKNDTVNFVPQSNMSAGLYDRINLDVNCTTFETKGYITSKTFGPAKAWKKVKWAGSGLENNNDVATLQVIGKKSDGTSSVLHELTTGQSSFDISSLSASDYPFIELRLQNTDTVTATPYQLNSYGVEYEEAPEGGLAPNLYFNFPDTVGKVGSVNSDTLNIGVAYKNASKANFDSLTVRLVLYDTLNNAIEIPVQKTRPLAAGDTLHIVAAVPVTSLHGSYNVYLQVNTEGRQYEQESFNNFLYKDVFVQNAGALPVTLTDFNAYLTGGDVRTTWLIQSETNTRDYVVEHSVNGTGFKSIGKVSALNNGRSVANYEFIHANALVGKNYYRLLISDKDGSTKLSPVRLVTVGKGVTVNIYPNPVKDKLFVSLNNPTGKPGTITLANTNGQKLLQRTVNGTIELNMTAFASGTYLLQVNDGHEIRTYKVQKQ